MMQSRMLVNACSLSPTSMTTSTSATPTFLKEDKRPDVELHKFVKIRE